MPIVRFALLLIRLNCLSTSFKHLHYSFNQLESLLYCILVHSRVIAIRSHGQGDHAKAKETVFFSFTAYAFLPLERKIFSKPANNFFL